MFREGLALALRQEDPDLAIETAGSGTQALALLAAMPSVPDAVMTDFYLPDLAGAALLGQLRRCRAGLRILVLSASEDPQDAEIALAEGAHGFVHKSGNSKQLMDALRRVMQGQSGVMWASPLGPASMPILAGTADPLARLSARQTEVLHLLCEGLRNADIALCSPERTVKTHISAIFAALEVNSRTQAVIMARRAGLLGRPR
jgi:DNA-binding NarL/FixJ family response regulator